MTTRPPHVAYFLLGAGLAHHLELPLAASWHTNMHEYLARRKARSYGQSRPRLRRNRRLDSVFEGVYAAYEEILPRVEATAL